MNSRSPLYWGKFGWISDIHANIVYESSFNSRLRWWGHQMACIAHWKTCFEVLLQRHEIASFFSRFFLCLNLQLPQSHAHRSDGAVINSHELTWGSMVSVYCSYCLPEWNNHLITFLAIQPFNTLVSLTWRALTCCVFNLKLLPKEEPIDDVASNVRACNKVFKARQIVILL